MIRKDRYNNYNIVHKETGLLLSDDGRNRIIDYEQVFFPNKTKFMNPRMFPESMVFSYNEGMFFRNIDSLLWNIEWYFINPLHYKNKDLQFNSLKHFVENFDIVHKKTKESTLDNKFLEKLLKVYIKEKVNSYSYAMAEYPGTYSSEKILYDNILKIKYGIIYKTKEEAKEFYNRFRKSGIDGEYEYHHSGIFFQDDDSFMVCNLLSGGNNTVINYENIITPLIKIEKEFRDEFLLN